MSSAQVPEGYKQTEVGVIPEDWQVRPLLSTISIATGQVDPRDEPYKSMVLVAPDHVETMTGRLLELQTAEDQGAISGKYLFNSGDIIYSKIRPYLRKVILADFRGMCSADMYPLTPAKDVSSAFIFAVLLGHRFSQFAENVSARSGIPKINREELAEYTVALPPLPEQQTIAQALSDVDALIASLDKLIAKQRHLKTAAMQQLLTGKMRLPGFSGEWQTYKIGELFEITAGGDLVKNEYSEINDGFHSYPIYANSIFDNGLYGYSSFKQHEGDCITVTARGTLGVAYYRPTPFVAIGRLIVLKSKNKVDSFFLSESINHRIEFASESTGVPQLTAPQIAKYELSVPILEEQRAIATVLSDMDTAIAALETRRAKTQAIKQGMMQELLTGRTRLV
jgi:type I restriction enzyme, S subunit